MPKYSLILSLLSYLFSFGAKPSNAQVNLRQEFSYKNFVAKLDLTKPEDFYLWAETAGIQVAVLTKPSNFFYFNTHMIPNPDPTWTYQNIAGLKTQFDAKLNVLTIRNELQEFARYDRPEQFLTKMIRINGYLYNDGYSEDKIQHDLFKSYAAKLDDFPHWNDLAKTIPKLPSVLVQALRGKGVYFSVASGRSYSILQPVSNEIYLNFIGFIPGAFIESNSSQQIPKTFVHELCHVLEGTAIDHGYGKALYPYQYPELHATYIDNVRLFGKADDQVTNTDYGYISKYSKSNAQENFAEHCMHFILFREVFKRRAVLEDQENHSLLLDKYEYFESLFQSSVTTKRLSEEFIATLNEIN